MRATGWIAAVLAITLLPVAGFCAEDGVDPDFTPARVIYRPTLEYPPKGDIEALVYVRLVISAEGLPEEVKVLEDRGFHNEIFREAALAYVKSMRFSPATLNGEAVPSGPAIQPINYGNRAGGFGAVSQEFYNELRKVEKLLKKKDYEGAHFHAEWMLREKTSLQFEYAVLKAQLAQTHAAVGHLDEALAAAREATNRKVSVRPEFKLRQPIPKNDESSYQLPKETILYLLKLRMDLQVQRGDVLDAIKTYYELAGLAGKMKPDDPRKLLAEKLTVLLESGKALGFNARVRTEYWAHDLYHPRYTVRNVKGGLGTMHLHCRGKFLESHYVPDAIWSVPEGWDNCVVEFYGDVDSTFELVELPAAAPVPAAG